MRPRFIGSEIYRQSRYGSTHPLGIARVSAVMDLTRALGWVDDTNYETSPIATVDELARFHDRDYIAAVMAAERDQRVDPETSARFNIGRNGNPVYGEIFRRPATACGASLRAAALVRDVGIIYSPAGGTHHGRRDSASGFCYFNDPVLGILRLLDLGIAPIAYVDIDAHHGDGVEAALRDEPRVLTVSVHEAGRWPHSGTIDDQGPSHRNIPLPPGACDDEMDYVRDHALVPLVRGFKPAAIMVQAGCDALADDPMSLLELSNRALWRVVAAMMPLAPRLIVLGGGGYNPWSVARCWTGVWATLNNIAMPQRLPDAGEAVLRALSWNRRKAEPRPAHWFTTLADDPRGGPVRDPVKRAVDRALLKA